MRLVIKNVGVGPALSLNGRAWIALVPEGREPTIAVANELIERVTAGIRGTVAHFELQASGLQAGASTANWIPSAPQRPSLKPGDRVAVVYEIDYENVFEDPFQVEATLGDRVISG